MFHNEAETAERGLSGQLGSPSPMALVYKVQPAEQIPDAEPAAQGRVLGAGIVNRNGDKITGQR